MKAVLGVVLAFAIPIVVWFSYVAWRRARARAQGDEPESLPPVPWVTLAAAGLAFALVATGAIYFYGGEPASDGKRYIPPRTENGVIIPGQFVDDPPPGETSPVGTEDDAGDGAGSERIRLR